MMSSSHHQQQSRLSSKIRNIILIGFFLILAICLILYYQSELLFGYDSVISSETCRRHLQLDEATKSRSPPTPPTPAPPPPPPPPPSPLQRPLLPHLQSKFLSLEAKWIPEHNHQRNVNANKKNMQIWTRRRNLVALSKTSSSRSSSASPT